MGILSSVGSFFGKIGRGVSAGWGQLLGIAKELTQRGLGFLGFWIIYSGLSVSVRKETILESSGTS